MTTLFILLVLAYFVIVTDVGVVEKLVLSIICGAAALVPTLVEGSALTAAIVQAAFGIYVCLRMTYVRAKA